MEKKEQVMLAKLTPLEELERLKHELLDGDDSASYCCESAEVVSVKDLPTEKPFE